MRGTYLVGAFNALRGGATDGGVFSHGVFQTEATPEGGAWGGTPTQTFQTLYVYRSNWLVWSFHPNLPFSLGRVPPVQVWLLPVNGMMWEGKELGVGGLTFSKRYGWKSIQ